MKSSSFLPEKGINGQNHRYAKHQVKRHAVARSSASGSRDNIYFATFPLVGFEALESALVFSGRELPNIMAQHCAIIVDRPSAGRCVLYDFLPESPTSPATAAALLRGGSVTGIIRSRVMRRVPPRRCTRIGIAGVPDAMQAADSFNGAWDKKLRLYRNDCRNYTQQLARLLLGDEEWQIEPSLMPPLPNPLRT